jgi:hypothetical protein
LSYPEKIPNAASNDFLFSFEKAATSAKKLKVEHSILEERIEKIVSSDKFFLSDYPILRQIMMLSPSKNELKLLSKALDRLADIVEVHQSVQQKLSVFKVIEEDPNWLALSFGDFSSEIDTDIESFFNSIEE